MKLKTVVLVSISVPLVSAALTAGSRYVWDSWFGVPILESVPQAPLSPVLRGEGLGVRGENPRETHPLTPTPLPLSTGGEGLLGQTLIVLADSVT
jgi:hypothetical protein